MREFLLLALLLLGSLLVMDAHLPRLHRPSGDLLLKTAAQLEHVTIHRKKKRESAREYVDRLNGRKRESLATRSYREARMVYETIGQADRYQRTLQLSLFCGALGAVVGLILGNVLLAAVLAVGLYFLPLWLSQFALFRYDKYLSDELETALSLITTSYLRSSDILSAVEENLGHLNEPVRGVFIGFCNGLKYVDANAPAQIEQMKRRLNNAIFRQWCDTLILCQDNHLLQNALPGIVGKFSVLKAQQQSNETRMLLPLKRAFSMSLLVAVVCPGLRMLNLSWYNGLMHTLFGQLSFSAAVIVIFVTLNKAIRLSRPITYDV